MQNVYINTTNKSEVKYLINFTYIEINWERESSDERNYINPRPISC
jgi:hypothetical protein